MTLWLLRQSVRRAPGRLVVAALGIAFPVAMLAATLLYVDVAVRAMTPTALAPVQVEMRALAASLDLDLGPTAQKLAAVPGVTRVDRFAAADVVVGSPQTGQRATARLFAVDPAYLAHHPWVRTQGTLAGGALLDEALRTGVGPADHVDIAVPGGGPTLLSVPVTGSVDLRRAHTWLAVPAGEVQGDIALVPRSVVIDYATFAQRILPALTARLGASTPVLNPGLTDLPPVDLELHVSVDHAAYPADPGRAAIWSDGLRRVLERRLGGTVVLADDAAENLTLAQADAVNAEILFLLLGIPGVLAAAALGLAADSALAAAHRREDALLRLRGATEHQLARLTSAHAVLAGLAGAAGGLLVAVGAVSAVDGRPVWTEVPTGRLVTAVALALLVAAALVVLRVVRLLRAGRRPDVVAERGLLERGWTPTWRRRHWDLAAVGAGVAVLAVAVATGGLRRGTVEGPPLGLAFYVLLAPLLLWVGVALLTVRGLLALLVRWTRPERARPLHSWWTAGWRWLGRRPARTAVALTLGVLAVAFGTEVLSFVATYSAARDADAAAAFGSDLRLTPTTEAPVAIPALGADVAAASSVRFVPVRVGSDRKSLMAIDTASYPAAATVPPRMVSGGAVAALAHDPHGLLVAQEIADGFVVRPGDSLSLTVLPDDSERSRIITFHVVGVFRSFAPTEPASELVASTAGLPQFLLPNPDHVLVRLDAGRSPEAVANALRSGEPGRQFQVTVLRDARRTTQRSLTALRLGPLARLEGAGAALTAGVGVAVLGAFLVLERRRESAVLRSLGADTSRVVAGPLAEGVVAIVGSLAVGVPLGLGLTALSVRVLGLFFVLPPPLLAVSPAALGAFVLAVAAISGTALAVALTAVARAAPAAVLREP
jgi:putative ABC transport system permease protein